MVLPKRQFRELSLFAGAGGGILGGMLLGWKCVCAVEIDSFCRKVLLNRQKEGYLPRFPIWDDVETFDGRPWRGAVDIISGGFPCQDISSAGTGEGITGDRSGLVFEMLRIVEEVQPRYVFAENSPLLRIRGLGYIIQRFTELGYDCKWCVLGAWNIGAPHKRQRMWILATRGNETGKRIEPLYDKMAGSQELTEVHKGESESTYPNSTEIWEQYRRRIGKSGEEEEFPRGIDWWSKNPFEGMDDAVPDKLDRYKATGNGQVPGVVVLAWKTLTA